MKNIELKFDPRPQQEEILEFVKDSIEEKEKKFIVIDAPTGTGKSYAAIMISDWYTKEVNKNAKIDIITNTKILQDQYVKDFDFLANLKGKNNYWCRANRMGCGDANIYNKAKERKCKACPHMISRSRFLNERVSITNYHLMISYSMYSPDMMAERGSNVLIIDEAHAFEEAFCDFVSSMFSERSLSNLDIWQPWMETDLEDIDTIGELAKYVKSTIIPRLESKILECIEEAKEAGRRKTKIELLRRADHADKTMCKYNRFINDKANYKDNWVFEKDEDHTGGVRILVEPIWASAYLKEMFWSQYDHVIFMSGTILNSEMFRFLMGLEKDEFTYLALPCPFKAEDRPITYVKFGKMSYDQKQNSFRTAIPIIKSILKRYEDHKGIIHTGNYEFNRWIQDAIKDKRLLIHDQETREKSLEHHLESEFETVLVSPSMINGVDLKDELSRFQVILKVPFPNLKSMKIKKRLETYPDWYNWRTLVDIMQAYGRSIRNDKDWADTFILDACFDQVVNDNAPDYFVEAIKVKRLPQ